MSEFWKTVLKIFTVGVLWLGVTAALTWALVVLGGTP